MKKIFVLLTLTGSIAFAAVMTTNGTSSEVREYSSLGIEKIRIENTSGKTTVSPMLVNKIEILAFKRKFSEKCSYTVEKSDYAEIIVRVERPVGEDCDVDLDLKVPKEADLNIWSRSGDVVLNDLEGNLTFNVSSGSVSGRGKFKKIEGKSGSGSVDLSGLTSGGKVNSGSGSVRLRFLEYPMGRMEVKTGSGDANLLFPKGSRIQASLDVGSGSVNNEIGSYESADFGVTAKSGSGDLQIKAY